MLSITACSGESRHSVSANDAMPNIGDTGLCSVDGEITEAGTPSTTDAGIPPTTDSGSGSPVVGFIADTLTYRPIGYENDRTLPVYLWYRSDQKTDTPAVHLFLNPENAYVDAPPVDQDPAPLIVFSHDRRGFGAYSYFIAEYFALQGFIVAAIDHTGERIRPYSAGRHLQFATSGLKRFDRPRAQPAIRAPACWLHRWPRHRRGAQHRWLHSLCCNRRTV